MHITCPNCGYDRKVEDNKIPPSAVLATCPKCGHRFRFRPEPSETEIVKPDAAKPDMDLWDAIDSLHSRWKQEGKLSASPTEAPSAAGRGYSAPQGPELRRAPENFPAGQPTTHSAPAEDNAQGHFAGQNQFTGQADYAQAGYAQTELPQPAAQNNMADAMRAAQSFHAESAHTAPPGAEMPDAHPQTASHAAAGFADQDQTGRPVRDLGRLVEDTPWGQGPEAQTRPISEAQTGMGVKAGPGAEAHPNFQDAQGGNSAEYYPGGSAEAPHPYVKNSAMPGEDRQSGQDAPEQTARRRGIGNPHSSVAWEQPGRFGRPGAFFSTLGQALLQRKGFFSSLASSGSLLPAFIFYALMSIFHAGSFVFWRMVFLSSPAHEIFQETQAVTRIDSANTLLVMLIMPLASMLALWLISGAVHQILHLVQPAKSNFHKTFRAVAYASAPLVFSILPFAGPFLARLLTLLALFGGIRYAHHISRKDALLCVLPFACLEIVFSLISLGGI